MDTSGTAATSPNDDGRHRVTGARPGANALVDLVRASVIGDDEAVAGPFGIRRVTYADYTASGRSLTFIEDYIRDAVLPLYANTHTESSGTGLQTTRFREEARRVIREGVRRRPGATTPSSSAARARPAAINRLVDVLNLRLPADLDDALGPPRRGSRPSSGRSCSSGPYEHHCNELPWRESIADVVTIHEDGDGHIDLAQLERGARDGTRTGRSRSAPSRPRRTSPGSSSDTRAISRLLHEHGALSFWDFAAAAPYVEIEMDPPDDPLAYKDAIFISPHKFIGGPGTPGVLVARRELFRTASRRCPAAARSRTSTRSSTSTSTDIEHREEGGTPAIVESIRAGLVFQLKEAVGRRGDPRARGRLHRPRDRALGGQSRDRDPRQPGRRTGCRSCPSSSATTAGTCTTTSSSRCSTTCSASSRAAAARAPGRTATACSASTSRRSHEFEREIARGCEGIKPGWVRVNFNYFISEAVFEFILDAVDLVATRRLAAAAGLRVRAGDRPLAPPRRPARAAARRLHDIRYDDGRMA